MTVSLVTCVTNGGGIGPGHSCLDIDGTIYTFEGLDYGGNRSAWRTFPRSAYLKSNQHRPVYIQELVGSVNTQKALSYIRTSTKNDDDYATSGVCSSQAASAIEHAWGQSFDTWGIDKPYEIFDLARTKRIVRKETMYWPGRGKLNIVVRTRIDAILKLINAGFTWSTG